MIFSYSDFDIALRTLGHYYDKVLLVNFSTDEYKIIKINDSEYRVLQREHPSNFYDWISNFKNSKYSMNLNYDFDLNILDKLEKPLVLNYKKLINGSMKDVTMELVPIGGGRAFIFVKDFTADMPKLCEEDCEKCQHPC